MGPFLPQNPYFPALEPTSKVAKHPKRAKNTPPSRAIGRFSGFILLDTPFLGHFAPRRHLIPEKHPKEPKNCPPLQGNRTVFGIYKPRWSKKHPKTAKSAPPSRAIGRFSGFILLDTNFLTILDISRAKKI